VLHWFTGTKSDAQRVVELEYFFAINRQLIVMGSIESFLRVYR